MTHLHMRTVTMPGIVTVWTTWHVATSSPARSITCPFSRWALLTWRCDPVFVVVGVSHGCGRPVMAVGGDGGG